MRVGQRGGDEVGFVQSALGASGQEARTGARRTAVDQLQPGERVRLGDVNVAHLAALVELRGSWEPLLITEGRRIIDGHYRYLAARHLGYTHVDCLIFDGLESEAFVQAVRSNIKHGLPLTLLERKSAAREILSRNPQCSDRYIAGACGLAHDTVGRIRKSNGYHADHACRIDNRQGKDGKSRRLVAAETRARILQAIEEDPKASLRHLANVAGSTHETVRAVRRRIQESAQAAPTPDPPVESPVSPSTDAAFTSTDAGSSFAAWFERTAIGPQSTEFLVSVPLSRVYEIADEARRRADAWSQFSTALLARVTRSGL